MKLSFNYALTAATLIRSSSSFTVLPSSPALLAQRRFCAAPLRATSTDIGTVRQALADLVKTKNCGPILIRLAWHDAGTYNVADGTGGPRGCMRFAEGGEAKFGANNGLDIARALVQPIKDEVAPDMSYADFWALASIVAVKEM